MDGVNGPRPKVQPNAVSTSDSARPAAKAPATPAPAATSAGWVAKSKATGSAPAPGTTSFVAGPQAAAARPMPALSPSVSAAPLTAAPAAAPKPKSIDEAFDTMAATSAGPAEVRRHVDNVMAWNSKWDIVTSAEKTIDFSYFSIEQDAYGHAYLGALLAQQMKGVQVTGVTDWMANSRGHGFTGTGQGADYMQELAQYGAKIGVYNKLGTRAKSVVEDGLTYKAISSDHDKLAVADAGTPNAMGETGGRNVAGAYHQSPLDNPKSWRDDSIQLKGPVNDGLVTALRREMDGPAVTLVKPDLYNFTPRATELLGSYQLMEKWTRGAPLSDAEKAAVRADPAKRQALAGALYDEAIAALRTMPNVPDKVRSRPLSDKETANLKKWAGELANDLELKGSRQKYDALGDYSPADVKIIDQVGAASAAPGQRFNEMAPGLMTLIDGAQKEIVIQNPYVVMTEEMMKGFEDAAKRGVKITIVTNSPESTDSAVTQGFFLNDWKKLEERVPTARIFVATGERKFHSKAFVADGKVSGDTSYNADLLSGMVNGEIGAVTRSEKVATDLLGHIYDDMKDPANKFKEWTILRDASGVAVHGADGQPVAVEGPEQDVSKKLLQRYKPMQFLCDLITHVPLGAPLARPD